MHTAFGRSGGFVPRYISILPIAGSAAWVSTGPSPIIRLSKNRYGRFRESDVYRVLFEDVVGQCIRAGLVGGEGFAVDGSLIGGDARRDRRVEASRQYGRTSHQQDRFVNTWRLLKQVTRFIGVMPGIFRRPIPPLRGTPRKGAANLVISVTTWLIPIMQ
jgi:hypothetical protein